MCAPRERKEKGDVSGREGEMSEKGVEKSLIVVDCMRDLREREGGRKRERESMRRTQTQTQTHGITSHSHRIPLRYPPLSLFLPLRL
jgi:hypothetical protein